VGKAKACKGIHCRDDFKQPVRGHSPREEVTISNGR
jgi:hypothetical protein